jgi:phage repressor protein C with HTH and peptisase S24 domain
MEIFHNRRRLSTTVVDIDTNQTLQSRLDKVLRQFGSVADLARVIGVSDNAIYKWLSGRGQPSVANLVALANAAKVSLAWLATGHEEAPSKRATARGTEHNGFAYVARYDVKGPGPRGELLRSDQIVDYLAFKKEWIQSRLNLDPRNLLLIEAVGDSMTPTLEESDLLLVDLGEPRFRHDGIYVLRRDNELAVKRLQRRPDGTLNIISDNPAYESSTVASDSVHIIGRVIWAAGRL